MHSILLLEDDRSFGYILSEYLQMHNFEVHWEKSGEAVLDVLEKKSFDLAILDIMLPGIDGFKVAQQIQSNYKEMPFIFLSAKSLKIDKLKGFKLGAFDYITKPVDEELLVAKINALLNRIQTPDTTDEYLIGAYNFQPSLFLLSHPEKSIKLTARETALLEMLCQHENQLLSRKKALREIWNSTDEFSRKSMDVFISHLRKYLAKDTSIKIENVHGQGFILKCN